MNDMPVLDAAASIHMEVSFDNLAQLLQSISRDLPAHSSTLVNERDSSKRDHYTGDYIVIGNINGFRRWIVGGDIDAKADIEAGQTERRQRCISNSRRPD